METWDIAASINVFCFFKQAKRVIRAYLDHQDLLDPQVWREIWALQDFQVFRVHQALQGCLDHLPKVQKVALGHQEYPGDQVSDWGI